MKPGTKPKGIVHIQWSVPFAYAIGLLVADGCLSKDGRHIDFTSKDLPQIELFKECLRLGVKTATKRSGAGNLAYRIQFGDVLFYRFLTGIRLSPAKSKTLSSVAVPEEYFADFVRGFFDGDGCSYSFYDSVFKKSYRFCISFASASPPFLWWLQEKLEDKVGIRGSLGRTGSGACMQLKYSKKEAARLSKYLYYQEDLPYLKRKYLKIDKSMGIIEGPRWRNW